MSLLPQLISEEFVTSSHLEGLQAILSLDVTLRNVPSLVSLLHQLISQTNLEGLQGGAGGMPT